ncbi:polysaccharide deacetylase family protein [Psychromonas arctica]|uniref:Polysaccharide deacetylase family protein n=1 Tax=Psychromonas arctica TaxID=168275 RepID=A0ABU9H7Q6_9GAMM
MPILKTIILRLIFNLGIFSFFHYIHRKKITILYAHSIVKSSDINSSLWQPLRTQHNTDELTFTLSTLSKRYQFISLSTAIKILKKEIKPINNALVITLDDGYLNNIKASGPIFSKFNIHPAIFVSSEHTEKNIPFWFDRLDYALQQIKEDGFSTQILGESFMFDCTSRKRLTTSYSDFRRRIKLQFNDDQIMRNYLDTLSTSIEMHTGKALKDVINDDIYAQIASWKELKSATERFNFEIGSHTINHARIGLLNENDIDIELSHSKRTIEYKLQLACNTFCYPDNSYKDTAETLVKKYYQCALTTDPGLNKVGDNMIQFKRMNLPTGTNQYKILYKISALKLSLQNTILG